MEIKKWIAVGNRKGRGEKGTALVITLMTLVILIIIGLAALMTSSLDLKITGNEQMQKKAFYAADAGVNYVQYKINFYSKIPIAGATPIPEEFTMAGITSTDDKNTFDSGGINFLGTLKYLTKGPVPEGPVVFGADFVAHHFVIDCTGKMKDSDQAKADLRLHGYVVGPK